MIPGQLKRSLIFMAILAASLAHSSNSERIGAYDFSYDITGDVRVRPVQVFDDGRSTYFQFRSGDAVPAIFVMTTAGPVLSMPEFEGPYVRLPSISGAYLLRMGYGVGQVKYSGGNRGTVPAQLLPTPSAAAAAQAQSATRLLAATQQINGLPADMFAVSPAPTAARLEVNSYATPIRGDKVEWAGGSDSVFEVGVTFHLGSTKLTPAAQKAVKSLASRAAKAARVEIVGRDDPAHKEGAADARAEAVASILTASGVPRAVMALRTTVTVKDATRASFEGVSIRLVERAKAEPTPTTSAASSTSDGAIMQIVARLRAREISPAVAVDFIERARSMPTVVPVPAAVEAHAPATPKVWTMLKADESIQRMLERWGKDAGWRVVWEGAPLVPIVGDARVDRPDFLQAAEFVVKQAKAAGYHLKATAYSNQVLQILGE